MKNYFLGTWASQYKYQQMYRKFLSKFSATEFHGEFHSDIIVHANTITSNSVFYTGFFSATALLVKLPRTSPGGLLSV